MGANAHVIGLRLNPLCSYAIRDAGKGRWGKTHADASRSASSSRPNVGRRSWSSTMKILFEVASVYVRRLMQDRVQDLV